jgi:hypothetical protein
LELAKPGTDLIQYESGQSERWGTILFPVCGSIAKISPVGLEFNDLSLSFRPTIPFEMIL